MSAEKTNERGEREVASLSYEEAKEELVAIVATLENGSAPLEESMRLWERGEALAAHCTRWLDGAQARLEGAEAPGRTQAPTHSDDE